MVRVIPTYVIPKSFICFSICRYNKLTVGITLATFIALTPRRWCPSKSDERLGQRRLLSICFARIFDPGIPSVSLLRMFLVTTSSWYSL